MIRKMITALIIILIIGVIALNQSKENTIVHAALNQNIEDINQGVNGDYTYNITNIKLEEIENKGIMIEFKLSFKVEAGQIDKIRLSNYEESCSFDGIYVVSSSTYNLTCKIENLDYDTKYEGGEIEFVLNDNLYIITKQLNSFKTKKVDLKSLKVYSLENEIEEILEYMDYSKNWIDNKEKVDIQIERINEELDEIINKASEIKVILYNEELAYEKIYSEDNMQINNEKLLKKIEEIKKEVKSGINEGKTYSERVIYEINYGGHIIEKEILISIRMGYRVAPSPLNLKIIADTLITLLGGNVDPNLENKYQNIFCDVGKETENCFSKAASDFIRTLHGAIATIAIGLYGLLITKKVIEKSYETKKVKYDEVIKYILLLFVVKITIDNSLLIVEFVYDIVISLINVVASIQMPNDVNLDLLGIVKHFFYKANTSTKIFDIIKLIGQQSGYVLVFMILSLIAIVAFYVTFAYMLVHSCIIIFKRYVYILIYAVISPITICFFLDAKLSMIGKNHLKGLSAKLFSGFILTISFYLMIVISGAFLSIESEVLGPLGNINEIKYPIRWLFGIATPILMLQVIKSVDEFTGKIIGA